MIAFPCFFQEAGDYSELFAPDDLLKAGIYPGLHSYIPANPALQKSHMCLKDCPTSGNSQTKEYYGRYDKEDQRSRACYPFVKKRTNFLRNIIAFLRVTTTPLCCLQWTFNKVAALVEKEKQTTELEVTMLKKESATQQSKGQNNNG